MAQCLDDFRVTCEQRILGRIDFEGPYVVHLVWGLGGKPNQTTGSEITIFMDGISINHPQMVVFFWGGCVPHYSIGIINYKPNYTGWKIEVMMGI